MTEVTEPFRYRLLIGQLLKMPIAQASRREIVYRGDTRLTYPQFAARVHRFGGVLRDLGAGMGTRVAFMDWDSHRYLEAYFAVPMAGAVLMMVNIRLSPEQIAYTIDHSGAEILFVHADFLPVLAAIRERLPKLRQVVLMRDDDIAVPEGFAGEYESLLAATAPLDAFPEFDEDTLATTFYTTGTTGLPKGVMFTHRQLVLHTLMVLTGINMSGLNGGLSREDVYMPLTPMFHVHAWGFPYAATMLGMQQVYVGRFLPEVVLRLLVEERVTVSHCVPTIMHMILNAPAAKAIDLSRWRVVIGGSALPRPLCEQALARGIDIFAGYGMSETCPVMTLAQLRGDILDGLPDRAEAEIGYRMAAGLPGPLVEVRIVDEAMNDVPHDGKSVGEVVTRTPALTPGYAGNPEASAALWRGGWLHTGDIGTIDADGYLRIVDRVKDVIKTGGEWISSIGLEEILLTHPAVSEAAVVGVADERWGERPVAFVVLRAGMEADEAALRGHVQARADAGAISRYAVPDRVHLVETLDKTSVGKLDKKAMRARATGGAA
ncbi:MULTISPECIES: fatty acid--CoA ligase [unclassified Acidiphilium]|jgi:fatty-acyl-CoA synthase|uniref:fatty acid--CoA ligase n=1 Tax=unclassified Acidiphilium TaxID=2617493 RepID=UPI000214533C|nr:MULTISPECIES: fatty acid--CoA ligase [unclassified Acidiphilium]EGO94238.1 AMP-dependent synthetase and ligase [Acidiphilium sp. PM]MBU6357931.1 fatty acid--CoA ligase [Rhodospirillales bacterium]